MSPLLCEAGNRARGHAQWIAEPQPARNGPALRCERQTSARAEGRAPQLQALSAVPSAGFGP
jgi:hypothetical protein